MSRFDMSQDGGEVQALVRTGFGSLTHARYLLVSIRDAALAALWIGKLLQQGLIRSAAGVKQDEPVTDVVQLAFSHSGLISGLGLQINTDFPFPTIFAEGMAAPQRAPLLGDKPAERADWQWGDVDAGNRAVHLLVAQFGRYPLDATKSLHPSTLAENGLQVLAVVETCPQYMVEKVEPFGFADGVSQPFVPELHSDRSALRHGGSNKTASESNPHHIAPGELLLGHLNEYGEYAYCPDVKGFSGKGRLARFARNGTYVAVRQIWQDTAALHAFDPQLAGANDERDEPTSFERIIGRRKGGKPLLACPVAVPSRDSNDFRYRVDDSEGFHCPRGAHIRRANPRDALGWDRASGEFASKLHRIVRRGRVYRDAPVCSAPGEECASSFARCGQGLFFMALNADLERQFEFVQRHWLANPKFADLWSESDALGGGEFSLPGYTPVGKRLTGLPQFTKVVGGGYFFLPSLSALRFIAGDRS